MDHNLRIMEPPSPSKGEKHRITPGEVRYIKLGRGGKWVERSFTNGEIHFGFNEAPHELALRGSLDTLRQIYLAQGHSSGVASRFAKEILEFYNQPAKTLWITFAHKRLWWCFAEPEVIPLKYGSDHGSRMRRTIDGWHCKDVLGRELDIDALSSHLTKTAAYRATICKVEARDYLLRRLNAEPEPAVVTAEV